MAVDAKGLDVTFVRLSQRVFLSICLGASDFSCDAGQVKLLEEILGQVWRGLEMS